MIRKQRIAENKRMDKCLGNNIHYDYMTVRADDIAECGHYAAFGWTYVADESERGGRYSFRRISCPSVREKLDAMQSECETLLGKVRKIERRAVIAGALVAAIAVVIGLIAFVNGMNMCIGETVPFNATVSAAAGVLAFAAAYPVYARAKNASLARRSAEKNNHKVRIAQICGEARKVLGKSR